MKTAFDLRKRNFAEAGAIEVGDLLVPQWKRVALPWCWSLNYTKSTQKSLEVFPRQLENHFPFSLIYLYTHHCP